MNKIILSFLIIAICTLPIRSDEPENSWFDDALQVKWQEYKNEFSKAYENFGLEVAAFKNWLNNQKKAQSSGNQEWVAGDTVMSDLSEAEFVVTYLTLQVPERSEVQGASTASSLPAAPSSKNWVTEGKVPAIKSQGGCGSCWAFGVIGAIESLKLIKEGQSSSNAVLFSEQNLVDCSKGYGGLGGCSGGWPSTAMTWISANGMVKSADWIYRAKEQTCPTNLTKVEFKITGSGSARNDADLEKAIATQPVVVAVDASKWGSYKGGIFGANTTDCSTKVNHAVIAVGYTPEYWLIRNSWGTRWGEQGYMRLSRARSNTCGVSAYASYPLAASSNDGSKKESNNNEKESNNTDGNSNQNNQTDLSKSCPGWVKAGYCTHDKYGAYVRGKCPASCNVKPTPIPDDVKDIITNCASWAANGLCTCPKYRSYMQENCARTCYGK